MKTENQSYSNIFRGHWLDKPPILKDHAFLAERYIITSKLLRNWQWLSKQVYYQLLAALLGHTLNITWPWPATKVKVTQEVKYSAAPATAAAWSSILCVGAGQSGQSSIRIPKQVQYVLTL